MNRFEALMRRAALVLALLLTTACGGGEEEPRTPPAEPPREIEVDASSTLYGFVGDTAGEATASSAWPPMPGASTR